MNMKKVLTTKSWDYDDVNLDDVFTEQEKEFYNKDNIEILDKLLRTNFSVDIDSSKFGLLFVTNLSFRNITFLIGVPIFCTNTGVELSVGVIMLYQEISYRKITNSFCDKINKYKKLLNESGDINPIFENEESYPFCKMIPLNCDTHSIVFPKEIIKLIDGIIYDEDTTPTKLLDNVEKINSKLKEDYCTEEVSFGDFVMLVGNDLTLSIYKKGE